MSADDFVFTFRKRTDDQRLNCALRPDALQKLFLHLFGIGGQNAPCFSEKRQKNLPANIGGHTFDIKNIIGLLKYSERIHIG